MRYYRILLSPDEHLPKVFCRLDGKVSVYVKSEMRNTQFRELLDDFPDDTGLANASAACQQYDRGAFFPDQKIDRFPYLVFATYRRYDLRIHHRKYSSGLKSETLFCDEVLAYNFFRLVSRPHKARKNPPSRRKSIFNLPVRVGR